MRPSVSRKKPVEEGAIAPEREPEVLRRHVGAVCPLFFKPTALVSECSGELLDHFGDQLVSLGERVPRLVPQAPLNVVPTTSILVGLLGFDECGLCLGNLRPTLVNAAG